MNISREEIQSRMEHFTEKLKKEHIKLTHQRIEIFREVAKTGDHPDAETIYRGVRKRIQTVSLDTVYRTLWMLIDKGLLTTLEMPGNRIRFDANLNLHHHFVCTRCGMTSDFSNSEFDKLKVPEDVNRFGKVERTHIELRGVCSKCLKPNRKKK